MSTEKDLKTLTQTDSLTPIVSQQESIEKETSEKTKPVFNLKQWVSIYRLTARVKFGQNLGNFSTVLACLPLAAGFSDFLRFQKSSPIQSESLFQKTLPVFANLQPKLTYETFHYVKGTFLELNSNKNKKDFFLGRPQFIATFHQSNLEKTFLDPIKRNTKKYLKPFGLTSFSGFSCSFSSISSRSLIPPSKRPNFHSTILVPQTLDELPGYVQGLSRRGFKSEKIIFLNLGKSRQKNRVETYSGESSKPSNKLLLIPSNFLLPSSFQSRLRLLQKSQIYSLSTPFSLTKGFWAQYNEFSNSLHQLDKEFQNLFIKKQISLGFSDVLDESFENESLSDLQDYEKDTSQFQKNFPIFRDVLENNSNIDEESFITLLLQNLENQTISKENEGVRFMSCYQYPDTTSKELLSFYKQREVFQSLFGKKAWLKTFFNTPLERSFEKPKGKPIVLGTAKFDFKIKKLPSVEVQTQEIAVKSNETRKTLYRGPSLLLDSESAFDWIPHRNLRSWFQTYLSPLNPFSQNFENFFGFYESPFSSHEKPVVESFQEKALFARSYVKQLEKYPLVTVPLESHFLPFRSAVFVSPDSDSSANNYVRGIDCYLNDKKQKNSLSGPEFLPLIQTKNLSFKVSSRKTTEFQGYSPVFDLSLTGKSDYIYSLDLITDLFFPFHSSSGQFKKVPSIFSKNSNEGLQSQNFGHHKNVMSPFPKNDVFGTNIVFGKGRETGVKRRVTLWEPLTSNYWLVFSQLSFAFFSFQILKTLAANYGRELLGYLLELIATLGLFDPSLKDEIELLLGIRNKGFRIIQQSSKTFSDIVGVQKYLPELYEVIWSLRNSARDFTLSDALPRGVLLTGPPGTGKTLLVQALAGEAHVPLIILSGSSLIEPGKIAGTKLQLVFQEARELAPCMVFIDEIDTLAPKRSGVVLSPMAHDDIVDFLNSFEQFNPDSTIERLEAEFQEAEAEAEGQGKLSNPDTTQQLSLLTQLLVELHGIRGRDGVLVIGATNRLESLDPALLRPGRFDQIIEVGLPTKEKRIDILKFYAEKLGYQTNIPWNYLGERTVGFSAADLATLMNESALKAILNKNEILHTLQTIEHGIDRLTTSETEKQTILKFEAKGNFSIDSKLSLLRFAYYQAGKIVVSSLLKEHPKSVFAALWPRRPNIRLLEMTTNLQTTVFEFATLSEITDRLVGCYAGKAAEFLFLEKFASSRSTQRSTLGLEDLRFGQTLAYALLEKFLFYSKKSYNQQTLALPENINELEFPEMLEKLALYEEIVETIEYPPFEKRLEEDTSSLPEKMTIYDNWEPQSTYFVPWWQQEASDALEFGIRNFHNWTRIYLENPERSYRNVEWRPYDEFYHTDSALKKVQTAFANLSKQKIAADNLEKSNEQKQQTLDESLTPKVQEIFQVKGLKKEMQDSKNEIGPKNEIFGKGTIQSEFETKIDKKNDVSDTKEQVASCENLEQEAETESSNKQVNIPWRNSDKNQTPYPGQSVSIPWNDVSNLTRDYPIHSLLLQSFNKALVILNQNRELVDRFVVDLLSQGILRQHEIEAVLQEFQKLSISNKGEETFDPLEQTKEFEIVEANWGEYSRKPRPRWIDFEQFSKQTT